MFVWKQNYINCNNNKNNTKLDIKFTKYDILVLFNYFL